MRTLWIRWKWSVVSIILCVVFWVFLSGCAWNGPLGDGCVLCDFVPSLTASSPAVRERVNVSALLRPNPVPRNPTAPFDGLVWIVLGDELRHINGLIAQKLAIGCGLYAVELDPQQRRNFYEQPLIPGHRYDLRVVVSRGDWGGYQNLSRVVADVKLVDLVTRPSPRLAHAVEFYGNGVDASGRLVPATYERAVEVAIQKAVHGMCFLDPLRGAELQGEYYGPQPQRNFSVCAPPCYEYQQTIGLYGTWGGPGIYSYWPTHERGRQHEHHRGQHHGHGGGKKGK